jgi:hypothetical protein
VAETVVDAESQDEGKGKTQNKTVEAQNQGISDDIDKIRGTHEALKIIKAHPGTTPDTDAGRKTLERHNHPVHRHIVENNHVHKGNKEKEIKAPGVQYTAFEVNPM